MAANKAQEDNKTYILYFIKYLNNIIYFTKPLSHSIPCQFVSNYMNYCYFYIYKKSIN